MTVAYLAGFLGYTYSLSGVVNHPLELQVTSQQIHRQLPSYHCNDLRIQIPCVYYTHILHSIHPSTGIPSIITSHTSSVTLLYHHKSHLAGLSGVYLRTARCRRPPIGIARIVRQIHRQALLYHDNPRI